MPVYIIRAGDTDKVKIGFTSAAAARGRLVKMQVDSAEPLVVLRMLEGDRTTEAALHERFRHLRLRGEWFRFHPDMLGDLGVRDLPETHDEPKPRRRMADVWTPEMRARQSDIQRTSFSDPAEGARRRAAFRATMTARSAPRWTFQNLTARCGRLHGLSALLNVPLTEVAAWRLLPAQHIATVERHIGVPARLWAHLVAPSAQHAAA